MNSKRFGQAAVLRVSEGISGRWGQFVLDLGGVGALRTQIKEFVFGLSKSGDIELF